MQMKPYLIGQGIFHFVNDLLWCPPSHVSDCSDGSSSAINPFFIHWKQYDQLILSALLSSLSLHERPASCGRLSDFFFYLTHS